MLGRDEAEVGAKLEKYPGFGDIRGTREMVVAWLAAYAQIGYRYVTFHMPDAEDLDTLLLLDEEVLPKLAEL